MGALRIGTSIHHAGQGWPSAGIRNWVMEGKEERREGEREKEEREGGSEERRENTSEGGRIFTGC